MISKVFLASAMVQHAIEAERLSKAAMKVQASELEPAEKQLAEIDAQEGESRQVRRARERRLRKDLKLRK